MQLHFHEHLGVQIVDVFHKSIPHFHKFKTTAHEIESFFATVRYPFGPFCAVFCKCWRLVHLNACFPLRDNHIGWFCFKKFFFLLYRIRDWNVRLMHGSNPRLQVETSLSHFSCQEVKFSARKRQSPASSRAVRMAERSKALDSRLDTLALMQSHSGAFWSPLGGVGSNRTPDSKILQKLRFIQMVIQKKIFICVIRSQEQDIMQRLQTKASHWII